MSIISLPLTNQLTNGQTADGGQVLADLNAIASQVNANAAASGVNNDITALNALLSVAANVTATNWILYSSTINNSQLNGCAIDATSTGVTQPATANDNTFATTAYVTQKAFAAALPAQPGGSLTYRLTSTASAAGWTVDVPNAGSYLFANANYGGF